MTCSVSGHDEWNPALWLATLAGAMELYCIAYSGLPAVSRKKNFPESHTLRSMSTQKKTLGDTQQSLPNNLT